MLRGFLAIVAFALLSMAGCGQEEAAPPPQASAPVHASNVPPMAPTNIVRLAQASKDHTTLVAAIEAADYVTAVAASGPLTVFAPTNAAFDALPAGTVSSLLEPANADQLRRVLQYHVTTSALSAKSLRDGQVLGMTNGAKATIRVEGDQIWINDARILSSTPADNGMLHVIDAVLLPPAPAGG
ncbi:MAG TPA: fasciclin domain-containing protein [Myxococcota bacterium]|jgi:uncharacterized surface protein with fasciclin (FAS1) repeats